MRYIPGDQLTSRARSEVTRVTSIPRKHHADHAFLVTRERRFAYFFKHPLPLVVPVEDIRAANAEAKIWVIKQWQKRLNAKLKAEGLGIAKSKRGPSKLTQEEIEAKSLRELRRKPSYLQVESQQPFEHSVNLIKNIDPSETNK